MHIGSGLQFQDCQAPGCVDRQQIDHAALGGGESRNLPVDRRGEQRRFHGFKLGSHAGFEPGFRLAAV
jgi:hypothetical protein